MEDTKILSPHYLEAYNYFYSVTDNKMSFIQKRIYYSLEQVLNDRPERRINGFQIAFVNVKNDGKTMYRYVVHDGRAYDMYDGDVDYRKTRVFVLSGINDDGSKTLEHIVHIGYSGLYYNLVGMDGTTYDFKTYVIDWESEDNWKVTEFDEPNEDIVMCMDFMCMLADNNLECMTKDDMDRMCSKCVTFGFMREMDEPPVYLKDVFADELFDMNNEEIPF